MTRASGFARPADRGSGRSGSRTRAATGEGRRSSARAGSGRPSPRSWRPESRLDVRGDGETAVPREVGAPRGPALEPAQEGAPDRTARGPRPRRSATRCSSGPHGSARMSPTIATLRPRRFGPPGRRSRIVYRSRSACVGWACQPSPPLRIWPPKCSAARYGAPDVAWRITIMSPPSASSVRIVSTSDSPFVTERARGGDVHDVRREVLGRQLERDAGPGACSRRRG